MIKMIKYKKNLMKKNSMSLKKMASRVMKSENYFKAKLMETKVITEYFDIKIYLYKV